MKTAKIILGTMAALTFVSCSSHSAIKKAQLPMPAHFRHMDNGASHDLARYWEALNDPQINALVEQALLNNTDYKASTLRLKRDYAQARLKFADLLPAANAGAQYERTELSLNTGQPVTAIGIPRQNSLYTAALDFTYEIDLWGRVRNQYKAAHAGAKKSYFDHLNTKQVLIAETVKAATRVRAARLQTQTLQASWKARHAQALIAKARQTSGLMSLSDYLRVAAQSIDAQSQWEDARVKEWRAQTSLAILLGENPTIFRDELKPLNLKTTLKLLPQSVPSQWLRARTDVLAAEQAVIAKGALSDSALAEFFPKLSFDARIGVQSQNTGNLFSQASRFFSFGPQLSLPIFNAGATLANYQANRLEAKASLEDYKSTVLKAFKEAEDNLAGYKAAATDAHLFNEVYLAAEKVYGFEILKKHAGLVGEFEAHDVEVERNQAITIYSEKVYEWIAQWTDLMTAFGGGLVIKP